MSISKIVVGTDFSEEADIAVKHAMAMARHTGASITLVHALCMPAVDHALPYSISTPSVYKEQVDEIVRGARKELDELRESLHGQGVPIAHVFVDAMPERGIVRVAKDIDAELIIMGSHGRTGLSRFLIGSVAEKVARFAHCDVMVARGKESAGGCQRILVPIDFSELSDEVVIRAMEMVAQGGRVDLMHSWHLPGGTFTYWGKVGPGLKESIVAGAQEYGQKYVDKYSSDKAKIVFSIEEGDARECIEKRYESGGYDLVMMGSNGRKGINRVLLGSVSENVIRNLKGPVYIVRGQAEEESQ